MPQSFYKELPYIKNEFMDSHFDDSTGLSREELTAGFDRIMSENEGMPLPMLRAKGLEFLLENGRIQINPHNWFADKIDTGVVYNDPNADKSFLRKHVDEAGPDIMENRMYYRLNRRMHQELCPEAYELNERNLRTGVGRSFADTRHASPDWNEVFRLGIPGLLKRLEDTLAEKQAAGGLSGSQKVFYDAGIISYRAMLRYLERVHSESLKYDIPAFTECIEHLMTGTPQSVYDAMELTIVFTVCTEIGYEKVRTLGLLDRLWIPYYRQDIDSGKRTEDDVKDLVRFFFMRWNASKRGAQQPLSLGGVYSDGSNAINELTWMFLNVYEELNIIDPKILIRINKATPDAFLRKCCGLIRKGASGMTLVCDETIMKGYEYIGIGPDESINYVPQGCYEPFIMGLEVPMICSAWMNMAKAGELAIFGGIDPVSGERLGPDTGLQFETYEDFEKAFFAQLKAETDCIHGLIETFDSFVMQVNPCPVISGTMKSCVERGKDIYDGGLKYSNTTHKCFGIGTAVDMLMAVKRLVFGDYVSDIDNGDKPVWHDAVITMDVLREALSANWEGYEDLRDIALNDCDRYGNNLEAPDRLMVKIYDFIDALISNKPNNLGGVYRLGVDSVDFALVDGANMGATPDGRHAGDPTSKNLQGCSGQQKRGVTAIMQSLLKIGQYRIFGGAPYDFMVHPSAVEGEEGLDAMVSLIRAYFAAGGVDVQGNIISAEHLRAAQNEPEKYQDLQVRVCGWNDYFVRLMPIQQNEFIRQAEAL